MTENTRHEAPDVAELCRLTMLTVDLGELARNVEPGTTPYRAATPPTTTEETTHE